MLGSVFPVSQLSTCVNLFLSAHICLLFTVLAWFLLALVSPFQPILLVSRITIPEVHPGGLLFFSLIFWAERTLLVASQNVPDLAPPLLSSSVSIFSIFFQLEIYDYG